MPASTPKAQELAWMGDAVLALYLRQWLLHEPLPEKINIHEVYRETTSNQFLNALGSPSKVEAFIGQIYLNQGISAAFDHLDKNFLPLVKKHCQRKARF